jgi:hypothetical protein
MHTVRKAQVQAAFIASATGKNKGVYVDSTIGKRTRGPYSQCYRHV